MKWNETTLIFCWDPHLQKSIPTKTNLKEKLRSGNLSNRDLIDAVLMLMDEVERLKGVKNETSDH